MQLAISDTKAYFFWKSSKQIKSAISSIFILESHKVSLHDQGNFCQ